MSEARGGWQPPTPHLTHVPMLVKKIQKSKNIFTSVIEKYPNTDFAIDSEFKLNLINDILAAKEMFLGAAGRREGERPGRR